MNQHGQRNILISNPNVAGNLPYLPYIWAVLKSYFERHSGGAPAYRWLAPIFETKTVLDLLAPYRGTAIDVLGLSCYVWNWDLQVSIARQVKAENPDCLVVAGGPQPDYKDAAFFREYPCIDVVVVNDGEVPFNKILEARLRGETTYSSIRGLCVRDPLTNAPVSTGPPEVNRVFDYSPYVDQSAYFEELTARRAPYSFQAVLETNRGCPYRCSFCDWGSNTMSKVRQFDIARVRAEIDWLGRQSIEHMLLVDANFGILPRDPEIAEMIDSTRAKYGSPRSLYYSAAKNNSERSLQIARTFARSGFVGVHCLSLQHTRPEVLAATDRENISAEKLKSVARTLQDEGIPIDVQLILGIPGDTYDLWKGCLTDLMEWGIHDQYIVYAYNLLPNAPSADKAFRDRWKVGTSELYLPQFSGKIQWGQIHDLAASTIITESSTFSTHDWCRMNVFATLVAALHGRGVTRLLAIYLRLTHRVSYQAFYQDLIDGFFPSAGLQGRIYSALAGHYEAVLSRQEVWDQLPIEQMPRHPDMVYAARWAHAQIGLEYSGLWRSLRRYLLARYGPSEALKDLISYQENILILPDYDCTRGKAFAVRFDWPEYFARARRQEPEAGLPEPTETPGAEVVISDRACGTRDEVPLDWHTLHGEDRWLAWLERVVCGRGCADRTNFKHLTLRPASGPVLTLSMGR
jgi:putative methyltransferase